MLCVNSPVVLNNNLEESPSIEKEKFYRAIDRQACENILRNRINGSCVIRPYLGSDASTFFKLKFFFDYILIVYRIAE